MSKSRELRDVVNSVSAYVWSMSRDGSVDFVNQRWREFTGLSLDEALGWNWETVVHPEDRSGFVANWHRALDNGMSIETEVRVRRADGDYRWWSVRNVPLRDELGKVVKWYGTGIDIEDRKVAESLLAAEKRILEMTAKGDPLSEILNAICRLIEERANGVLASILLFDGSRLWHGAAPSLSKAYTDAIDGAAIGSSADSYGTAPHTAEEFTDPLWAWFIHLDLPHAPLPVFSFEGEVIVEDISTDPLWAQYRDLALSHSLHACWSMPVFSSEGKVIATFAMYYCEPRSPRSADREIVAHITHLAGVIIELNRTQAALRRSEFYRAEGEKLMHTGSSAFRRQRTVYWSEECFRLWGLDPQKGLPDRNTIWQRIHPEDRQKCVDNSMNAVRAGKDFSHEYRIVLTDGAVRHHRGFGHLVFSPSGDLIEMVCTAIDVTENKRVEQERRRLRQLEMELAHINRVTTLGELVASLAHELNQPIAAAIMNANTCMLWLGREHPDLQEARTAAMRVVQDGTRAAEIINHLKSFYKKDAPSQRELVDINEVILGMILLLENEAKRHSVAMRTDLFPKLPKVMSDRVQLQQVLMNLMLNAIEAMKEGGELCIESRLIEDGELQVSVRDTGVGLPPDKGDDIFKAFFTTKPQGTGMGLAISRSLIEAQGGRLWASANSDRGATFHFTLPRQQNTCT